MIKTVKGNIVKEEYPNISSFLNTNQQRRKYQAFGYSFESACKHEGLSSAEEADKAILFYSKDIEKFQGEISKVKTRVQKRVVNRAGVQGYHPIVPNAILGLPNSMVHQTRVPLKTKVVQVNIETAYPWNTEESEVYQYFAKVLGYLQEVEAKGYRVDLNLFTVFAEEGNWKKTAYCCKIKLKDSHQPLCLEKMVFSLTHSAMLRVFLFNWYETLKDPSPLHIPGYGKALYHWEERERKGVLELFHLSAEKYVYLGSNYEEIIGL